MTQHRNEAHPGPDGSGERSNADEAARPALGFRVARWISALLALAGLAAIAYDILLVACGLHPFSWPWLVGMAAAAFGAGLFGTYALAGRLPLPARTRCSNV